MSSSYTIYDAATDKYIRSNKTSYSIFMLTVIDKE